MNGALTFSAVSGAGRQQSNKNAAAARMPTHRPDSSALDKSSDDSDFGEDDEVGIQSETDDDTHRRGSRTFRCSAGFCVSLSVGQPVLTPILQYQILVRNFSTV